jgi:hypothetical protein
LVGEPFCRLAIAIARRIDVVERLEELAGQDFTGLDEEASSARAMALSLASLPVRVPMLVKCALCRASG